MSSEQEDREYTELAIQLAQRAQARGDHPFGCVVVLHHRDRQHKPMEPCDRSIVAVQAMNSVNTQHDPTGHAETNAIRQLGLYRQANSKNIRFADYEVTLYTSTEPCVMCCGAIYWSFCVDRVVYACSEQALAKHAGADFLFPCRSIFERGARPIQVQGPVAEAAGEALHAVYWKSLAHSDGGADS